MGAKAASDPWVGRPLPRLEDETLLRGHGRFIDDLDPVANARHAAVLRSQFAHARIARLDPSAALELPGVVGVLTGADVVELSQPVPGRRSTRPFRTTPPRTRPSRYVGEPLAVVVARDRYLAEDALELIEVEYEPLEPVLDAEAAVETGACVSDRSFAYGDVDAAFAAPTSSSASAFASRAGAARPSSATASSADWDDAAEASLTAWANFQGPFTLHSVAAAALGLAGSKLRLITPPDSGGSFGIKSTVYVYVVLMGLASRKLGVPVRWIEDRLEHLAGQLVVDRARHGRRGRLLGGRRAARAPLRRDRGRRRLRARARAGDALPDARVALGRVPRAERRRTQPRRPDEPLPERSQPRLRRPAALPRARADDDDRGDAARDRPGRAARGATSSRRTSSRTARPRAALYDSGDYEACLDDALALARLRRAAGGGRVGARGGAPRRRRARLRRRAVDLEHGLHHARARPARSARGLPKSGNAEGVHGHHLPARRHHGPDRRRRRRARATHGAAPRSSPTVSASSRATVEVLTEVDTSTSAVDDRVRQLLVALLRRRRRSGRSSRPTGSPRRSARSARTSATSRSRCAASRASRTGTPTRCPPGMEPGLARDGLLRGAQSRSRPTTTTASPRRPPTASSSTSPSSRSTATTGEVTVLDYVTVHDAGRLLNPLLADGQVRGGFAHGVGAALFERVVYDEDGNLLTGTFMDYLAPTAPDLPTPRIAHRETPSPFIPLGAKGLGEGTTMSVPAAIANAVADALGRDDVELPFTPGRVWELLTREAGSFRVPAAGDGRRGAVGARRGRRRREGARRRAEPRSRAEHARAAPVRARRRQPRARARRRRPPGERARRRSDGTPGRPPTARRTRCSPRSSPTSGTSSRGTAEPSAARSRTPTPRQSFRSRSSRRAVRPSSRPCAVAARSPPDELFLGPFTTATRAGRARRRDGLAASRPRARATRSRSSHSAAGTSRSAWRRRASAEPSSASSSAR